MTTYGWDASNFDDPITERDGVDLYTHKAAEGHHMYYDQEYKASLEQAKGLGIPVLGAYFVNHPGSVEDQVDWFIQILDSDTPWWRQHPCFILQIDSEKFSYMPSAPTLAEIQAFGDRLVNTHGVDPRKVIAYAPQWLYGNGLTGLTYRLWASAYGSNPYVHYVEAYPGDFSSRWQSYSGQSPLFLQYGSNTTIGNQTTCDANAFRGSLDELLATLGSGSSPSLKETDMFRLIQTDGQQYIIMADPQSPTGFSWVTYGTSVDPQIRCLAEAIPTVDARTHLPFGSGWNAGSFGPSAGDSRSKLISDIAAAVVAALPESTGDGITVAQVSQAVRTELDKTGISNTVNINTTGQLHEITE